MPKNPPTTAASAKETIAAIATASGRGGIGVVRISGAALAPLAEQLTGKPCPAPRLAALTRFLDEHGQAIDHGILLYFPAPHSFTGEDVLELHGHGGPVVLQLLLARCLALGARLARPGEFTERAFLNGKLDLAQAESVASLIDAATEAAARAAVRSLSGEFSARIRALADELLQLRLELEAALDFPEEEIDFISEARVHERLAALCARLDATRTQARRGAVLEHGLTLVLAGRPNVGKSSLLNALAEEERAIVTDLPGTTRDALHHRIAVRGIAVTLIDTAGLRATDDPVERLGIERAWQEIARADLVLRLLDASTGETDEDRRIAAQLPAGIPTLTVWNKTDLTTTPAGRRGAALHISARHHQGLEDLRAAILDATGNAATGEENVLLARTRHLDCLARTAAHLAHAAEQHAHPELLAEDLRLAHRALGEITGECTPDDLLGAIFSRFCIGK